MFVQTMNKGPTQNHRLLSKTSLTRPDTEPNSTKNKLSTH